MFPLLNVNVIITTRELFPKKLAQNPRGVFSLHGETQAFMRVLVHTFLQLI